MEFSLVFLNKQVWDNHSLEEKSIASAEEQTKPPEETGCQSSLAVQQILTAQTYGKLAFHYKQSCTSAAFKELPAVPKPVCSVDFSSPPFTDHEQKRVMVTEDNPVQTRASLSCLYSAVAEQGWKSIALLLQAF